MRVLLAEADRLSALAELVGTATFPARERVVLLAGRLLREGLLQQSALSPSDAYCAPERTARLARLILDAVDDCLRLTERGTPAGEIEVRDFSDLLRAKERP